MSPTPQKRNAALPPQDIPLLVGLALGVLVLVVLTILCTLLDYAAAEVCLAFLLIYVVSAAVLYVVYGRIHQQQLANDRVGEAWDPEILGLFRNRINLPYAVVDEEGNVILINEALRHLLGLKSDFPHTTVEALCSMSLEEFRNLTGRETAPAEENANASEEPDPNGAGVMAALENDPDDDMMLDMDRLAAPERAQRIVAIGDRQFRAEFYDANTKGQRFCMITFVDVTEERKLAENLQNSRTVVAYIILDNLEELSQYVRISYRSAAGEIEILLKQWAAELGGVLQEYDRDKYLLVFSQEQLDNCFENKFDILDRVRNVRLGDSNMAVTVSMGISSIGQTLEEKAHHANAALDTALQRGGDQIAIRESDGLRFFGGHTKTSQKRTRVRARVLASCVSDQISKASNVLIMGHKNPDFDSIGACVGLAKLADYCGIDAKIVVNRECDNFRACTGELRKLPAYTYRFIDGPAAMDLLRPNTLLIITDANNPAIFEQAELAENASQIILIDHHRKTAETDLTTLLTCIDPSASSASELVTEMLEQALPSGSLSREEANVILSGIMVDTNNFTRSVGTRTFSAALYLREEGADTEVARRFFREEYRDYQAEAMFSSKIGIHREHFLISVSDGTGNPGGDRIAAAKAADKFLQIRGIDAAFTLVNAGGDIHISARSNGSVNVQLILESIGGGGHFDAAGAKLSGLSMEAARALICEAVDLYLNPADAS